MKRIVMIMLIVLLAGCGGYARTVTPAQMETQKVFEVPGLGKDEIFEQSKIWIAKTFKSSKAVIEYENKERGVIIGNGAVTCHANAGLAEFYVLFTMEEEIKDGKIRIKTYNIRTEKNIVFYEAYRQEALTKISALKEELRNYLLQVDNKSNW